MNDQQYLSSWQTGIIAEEFGIYPWRYIPEENVFWLGKGASTLFGSFGSKISLDDFIQTLAPESLTRFTAALENALNFGQPFRLEILAETSPEYCWLQISGRPDESAQNPAIEGFIKDLRKEKKVSERLHNLEAWVSAGMSSFKVTDANGEILADLGTKNTDRNTIQGPGQRDVQLVDFRNKLKYKIVARTGCESDSDKINRQTVDENLIAEEAGLDLKLAGEERFVSLTRALGLRTDAQVSAIGLFDGSRFEWKAWWKSPAGTAVPAGKYGGEWLPDLAWLLEMEAENKEFSERYWWPQDMLPFPIADAYGKGWMLMTDRLAGGKTGLLALRSKQPEALITRKEEVISLLRYLHDEPENRLAEDSIEKLREEIVRREMLLKEMNHRAKNNLALAAGLVKMQAGFSEDRQTALFLKQTQKRLETLASLHELMYASPSADGTIQISDYLEKLVTGLHKGFGREEIKLEMNLSEANIHVRYANTLGLLVNEIVSNAFKHAWQNPGPGLLKIDFLIKGGQCKLRISDDGPGFSTNKNGNNSSLGSLLIDEFVKQLGAEMEINHNSGTTYLISIKKTNIGL